MKKYFILIITLFTAAFANAQRDSLSNEDIDVVKEFKPLLADILKIPSNPNPEVPEINPPKLEYSLPALQLMPNPTVYTIKPLAMGTSVLPKLKTNYFRIGYGNYNTPIFETYLTTVRNKNAQAGIYFKHFSASPSNNPNRSFSDNALKLWGKRFIGKGMVSTDVAYNRNVIHYYGFQPQSLDFKKNNLRRQYSSLDLGAGYSNVTKDTAGLRYDIGVRFYNFIDNNKTTENDLKVNANFNKRLNGNLIQVFTEVENNQTKNSNNNLDYNRVFIRFNPTYTLNFNQRGYVRFGFNTTLFADSNETKFFPYLNAEAAYFIIPKALTIFGGVTGNYHATTYRGLAAENPFISNWGLYNQNNKVQLFAGLRGEISAQTGFIIEASRSSIQNQLFYGFDSSSYGMVTLFDTTTQWLTQIRAELNHEFGERFHLQFVMHYFGYQTEFNKAYNRPTLTTRTSLMYNMSDKFIIRGDIYSLNQRYGIDLPSGKEIKLGGLADVNIGIDYRYNKNTGLFLNFNNLTNNQYQRWNNYQTFGLNILAGLSITF